MTNHEADQSSGPLPMLEASVVGERDVTDDDALFLIVGVGASAGGLEAFTQFLKALPADTGMAFVLVQHLSPTHVSSLAEILSRATAMSVSEVQEESQVEPNHVYVIPPGQSLLINSGVLRLQPREVQGIHRPIDQFFRALAEDRRDRAIGVVLSGTASDGTLGLEAIKAEGGITFAQDASAQHEGMPHSAVASGCVDFVLSPVEIANEIVRIGRHPYAVDRKSLVGVKASDDSPELQNVPQDALPDLGEVIKVLRQVTGVDFTHYKFNTLYRRVTRRMVFRKLDVLDEYVQYLLQTPAEVKALFQDILISVTSFFRDPTAFESLKTNVFPRLIKEHSRHDPVRIWTIGCSTGHEAYSLAMAFTEAAGTSVPFQLFATDLNPACIEKARAGIYPREIDQDVSPKRLQQFFTEVDSGYRISKTIRDACVFSRHNVLADPPFSRIDMISCRNLLIYLEPVLQQKILPALHYALKPSGCLWLGGSETIGGYRNLFEPEDAKHKIYIRKLGSSPEYGHFSLQKDGLPRSQFTPQLRQSSESSDLPREADRVLLAKFVPPGVLVSAELEILQYRGDTGDFLSPAPGKASLSLLKMLREGLLVAVRAAILKAGKEGILVREEGLRVKSRDGYREIAIEVIPVKAAGSKSLGGFLVMFEDCHASDRGQNGMALSVSEKGENNVGGANAGEAELDNLRLEQELAATREYLQSVIEQQESANEELQSANEEVQSANEELQSTNEELETSKEEIQSSNEELATVNDELNNRITELNSVNADLVNLMSSARMAIVMVGSDLRVRRFTPLAEKLLNLIPTDVGRPLADIKLNVEHVSDLEKLLAAVLKTGVPQEREVRDKNGQWYSLRMRPYTTLENKNDGIVIMLVDIDEMKRAEEATAYLGAIVTSSDDAILSIDLEGHIRSWNEGAHRLFGYTAEEVIGKPAAVLTPTSRVDEDLKILECFGRGETVNHCETVRQCEDGRLLEISMTVSPIRNPTGAIIGAAKIARNITDRKLAEAALQVSEVRYRRLFETAKDGILIVDAATEKITHVNPFLMGLLDYPEEYFLGKELWEIGVLRDKQACLAAMQKLSEIETIRYENLPLEDRHGQKHPVEMIANRYEEGEHRVIQCNIRDISERSRLEKLLRGQASELSDLHRRKDEFLAMLSHELRSPLAPIANAVQLLGLVTKGETLLHQQARGIIERQMGHLQHLVDDLLEVSRITTGRVQLRREQVIFSNIVNGAVETVRPLISQRQHELTVSLPTEPIWLSADAARLEQVLVNLLTNAAKYTKDGGHIWLTVDHEDDTCVLRVRDTGIGISAALLPHVFDLFTQAERSLDRSQGGLGIGLALVRRLTELHGGTVEAKSELGKGSEFIVRIPVRLPEEPGCDLKPDDATQQTARHLRVLVVDDNEDTVLSLTLLLLAMGHEVMSAGDGPAGVQLAIEFQPDVALLDIGLPGLNGYQVAERIRQEPTLQHVVLIAVTGYGQETDRMMSLNKGFDYHLVKPARLEQLKAILAKIPARELS